MTFVVEDGTGQVDAVSLVSVEFADDYFLQRGSQTWATLTIEKKQIALVKATDYINVRFTYKGQNLNPEQYLQFPKVEYGIPVDIKRACCEYAIRSINTELAPDIEQDASGLVVTSKTEKIGPIEESYSYAGTGHSSVQKFKKYPLADKLLSKYVKRGGGSYR